MGHRLEGCGDRRAHITSMALATLDLPLRSYRACFGLNPQYCFVLSDMARESGEISGGHDRQGCVILPTSSIEKVVGAGGRNLRCVRHLIFVENYRSHTAPPQVSAQAAIMAAELNSAID